jgi:hypothetical protein
MRKTYFKRISVSELRKENLGFAEVSVWPVCYIQCNKKGKHKPLSEVGKIWFPSVIIQRFMDGKPTEVFN